MLPTKIAIASDHAGFELKSVIKSHLESLKHLCQDLGADDALASVDYPDYAHLLAKQLEQGHAKLGILICGSGIGMSIAANRNKFIRAALCHTSEMAELARKHNDANVLVLGARTTSPEMILNILHTFLTTEFEGGRHQGRIAKL